ncbi:MAG TPA: AI-2E family transporter [Candidatus Paceibacterota bacterium]|nr:AI-2E family transporter [Candidatus Paceibacterota bacterium]HPT18145.1 AI-2E family transporter [Candidatus Paceibacterota bacterium]
MPINTTQKYFFFGLLFLTLIFAFFIFRPFWIVLALGASFAIVLLPINNWFKKQHFSNWLSSLLSVIIFIVLICGPLFGIGVIVFNQSQNVYQIVGNGEKIGPFLENINDTINNYLPNGISFNLNEKISNFISLISSNVAKIFSTTLSTAFSFLLLLLSIFYFLKDGHKWKDSLIALSPMSDRNDQKIITRLKKTVNGVIKGYLFIALCQGLLMGIGLAFFGVPNPALWGVIAAIASFIPTVGTALVSVPAVIFLYATGHTIEAIGMLVWAVVLVGLIDNLLSPFVIGKNIKIPEFIILFSVLGGIALLGPVGILIGPLVVSLLYTLISIYQDDFKDNTF